MKSPSLDTEQGLTMVRHVSEKRRARSRRTTNKQTGVVFSKEEELILQKAQTYLLFEAKRPMLWTVAGIRAEKTHDGRRWIIPVHLRYPNGFEGFLGDLVYDGTKITELTDLETMQERARQIAEDPEGIRQWNEYRASFLSPGEA